MSRVDRVELRGEAGLIGAGTVIWLALLGLVIYICAAAFGADTAQFGSVPVPGQGTVELREGAIDVYYAEGVDPDAGIPLVVPSDLNYVVRDSQGELVPDASEGDESKSTDDGLAMRIGELQAPEDGTYTVEAESSDAQQRITPELTFGEDPFAALKHRFSDVVDAFKGPLGILVLLALLILIFIPRYRRAKLRSSYQD